MPSNGFLATTLLFLGHALEAHTQLTDEFTVNCHPLTIQRGDPIIFPGVISPHVHIVTGGTAFQLTESNEAAVGAKATTCDKILDNSNYWQPQLYHQRHDGQFELVKMQGNVRCNPPAPFMVEPVHWMRADIPQAAYYLDRACNYEEGRRNCDGAPSSIAPPKGLRMVVGDPMRRYAVNTPSPAVL